MNVTLRPLAAMALLVALSAPLVACGPRSESADLAAADAALKRIDDDDPGDDPIPGELECSACVADPSSPEGGTMTCNLAPRKRSCTPPTAPTPVCTVTTAGGVCYRSCCTTGSFGKRCSVLRC